MATIEGWVVATSPLTIKTPGADTAVPAIAATAYTPVANHWVTMEIRTPQAPLITGRVV